MKRSTIKWGLAVHWFKEIKYPYWNLSELLLLSAISLSWETKSQIKITGLIFLPGTLYYMLWRDTKGCKDFRATVIKVMGNFLTPLPPRCSFNNHVYAMCSPPAFTPHRVTSNVSSRTKSPTLHGFHQLRVNHWKTRPTKLVFRHRSVSDAGPSPPASLCVSCKTSNKPMPPAGSRS